MEVVNKSLPGPEKLLLCWHPHNIPNSELRWRDQWLDWVPYCLIYWTWTQWILPSNQVSRLWKNFFVWPRYGDRVHRGPQGGDLYWIVCLWHSSIEVIGSCHKEGLDLQPQQGLCPWSSQTLWLCATHQHRQKRQGQHISSHSDQKRWLRLSTFHIVEAQKGCQERRGGTLRLWERVHYLGQSHIQVILHSLICQATFKMMSGTI